MSKKSLSFFEKYNTYKEVSRNYIGIRMFYKDLKYILISQEPKTEKFDLAINIANILGLFLGISFLSFFEVFEILIEIFFIYYK